MTDFTQVLLATSNPNNEIRNQAEAFLAQAEKSNLTGFLLTLIAELANDSKPSASRQAAGLRLKNIFESRNEQTKQQLAVQWKQLQPEVKVQIKQQMMATLHSNTKEARNTSAQLLSTLSAIELSQGQWIDVIQQLVANITQPKTDAAVESSLNAIGYLCDECRAPALQSQSDSILTAVIQGFRPEQKNQEIRLAAGKALFNILDFIRGNFQKDAERNFIMKCVCEATLSTEKRVRQAAMECIVKIAFLYYDKLKDYMDAIFQITLKLAKTDESDEVALQAIEVWSTISETEESILEDIHYAQENKIPNHPVKQCFHFVKHYLKLLVGLLTEILTNQEDDQSDDDWNRSSSAGTCLALVAKVAGDDVVGAAMPFISQNINNANWKFREAATLAFSAILDGPTSRDKMKTLVNQAVPTMLSHVTDKEALVRDTTVFTLGRIALFHFDALLDGQHLQNVIKALGHSLTDDPRVAAKAAWAIHNISEALQDPSSEQLTNPISQFFQPLVQSLLTTSQRSDVGESNLRTNTYAALSSLIACAAPDTYPLLENIVQLIIQRLADTLKQTGVSVSDKEEINTIQSLLANTLQSLTSKLGPNMKKYGDILMQLYLSILQSKQSSIHEATIVAISSLATALTSDFEKYIQAFKPFLMNGLKNKTDEHACIASLNCVADLSVALGTGIYPLCDEIITILLTHLQDQAVSRTIKPQIIGTFGDIALAIGGNFEKYLKYVAMVLKRAAEAQVDTSNDQMVEYLNMLRENIFEAYTGILQGLKKDKPQAFHPYVDDLVNFIKLVAQDETVDEVVFKNAVSVIGDLANVYGKDCKPLFSQEFIQRMVEDAIKSDDDETQEIGKWVHKQLKRIILV